MIKYLNIDARKGKKKLLARILRIIYSPFSKKQLYNKAIKIAKKYNNSNYKHVHNFFNSIGLNDTFEKKLFLDICRVDFENIKLPIPVKYDIVLKKYMEII